MNFTKTALLLGLLTGLFLLSSLLGGEQGALIALGLAAVMNFASYFWSDKIVLSSYRAEPVSEAEDPKFYAIVQRLASKAGIPMPRLYVDSESRPECLCDGSQPGPRRGGRHFGHPPGLERAGTGGRARP